MNIAAHAYSVRTTMLSLYSLKISYVFIYKISITLLKILICLGKSILNPMQKYEKQPNKWNQSFLFFYFITYYVLQSQSSFRLILFFWGVAYTQFFFEFLKLHSEPFKYWHSVNAQLELSFLLWISLYACRWVLRPELFLVLLWIEPALEPYGLQADDLPCQFLGEPHFPALFSYGQQFRYDREIGVYLFQPIVVFLDFCW